METLLENDYGEASGTVRKSLLASHDNSNSFQKRRSSTAKRKSLVETLQTIPTSPKEDTVVICKSAVEINVQSNSLDDKDRLLPTDVTNNSTASQHLPSLSNKATLLKSIDFEEIPDAEFVLDWYKSLTQELEDWKSISHEFKAARDAANSSNVISQPCTSHSHTPSNVREPIYKKYSEELIKLEQRFFIASKCISTCINKLHELGESQERWLNHRMSEEIKALDFHTDPKEIITRICSFHNMLSDDSSTVEG